MIAFRSKFGTQPTDTKRLRKILCHHQTHTQIPRLKSEPYKQAFDEFVLYFYSMATFLFTLTATNMGRYMWYPYFSTLVVFLS